MFLYELLELGLAVLPSVVIAIFLYRNDLYEKERVRHLWGAFGLGCLTVIPVLIIGLLIKIDVENNAFYDAFIEAALIEEVFKFLFFYFFIYNKSYLNEPYDGIIYAAFVSLGFATIENILYVFQNGILIAILRMFMAVPGHAIFGVLMGYYAGLAKFKHQNQWVYLLIGLLFAFLTHGLYDYFLFENRYEFLALLSVLLIIVGVIISRRAMRIHQRSSPFAAHNKIEVVDSATDNPMQDLDKI